MRVRSVHVSVHAMDDIEYDRRQRWRLLWSGATLRPLSVLDTASARLSDLCLSLLPRCAAGRKPWHPCWIVVVRGGSGRGVSVRSRDQRRQRSQRRRRRCVVQMCVESDRRRGRVANEICRDLIGRGTAAESERVTSEFTPNH